MKKSTLIRTGAAAAWALAASAGLAQQQFGAGNLVVLQVGADGGPALTSAAQPIFLKEIDPSNGAVLQTISLPTAAATTGNRAITQNGTATSEGFLTLSTDGRYLVFVGYNADAGTAGVTGTTSAAVARVVGLVDCNGVIDTTTALEDAYSAGNVRSATSTDGTDIWLGGTASGVFGGVRYAIRGATTSAGLNYDPPNPAVLPTNVRNVNIFDGQLYLSSASGAFQGIATVGTGLPTAAPLSITALSGFPTATGPSPYDFHFADANTLYVADDRSIAAGGGIQKWTFDGTAWTLQYTLNTSLTAGVRSIAGRSDRAGTTLYATTGGNNGNALVSVLDTGAASEFWTIAATGTNTWWRGVDFTPVCGGKPPACYANCDESTTVPILNVNDFVCFQQRFAAGDSYANCDGSTTIPILNVNDFVCFQQQFAAGCSAP